MGKLTENCGVRIYSGVLESILRNNFCKHSESKTNKHNFYCN